MIPKVMLLGKEIYLTPSPPKNNVSQDSSVSRVMGYGLDGAGLIPVRGKIFLFSTVSRWLRGPPTLLSNGFQV